MNLCVLCLLVVTGSGVHAWRTEYTATGQDEGEVCHKEQGKVWTCKKASECKGLQSILKDNGKLRTCSWIGQSPVLCCPPEKDILRSQNSKTEQKCAEYSKRLCQGQDFVLHSPVNSLSHERKRRQALNETVDYDNQFPVLAVYGGRLTLATEFPSMALIGYGDADSIKWECGGSLVSETYVLSAAHCVNTSYGLARWVRLGDLDIKSDTEEARPQQLEIVERLVHPGYRSPAYYNDLALFRLDRPVVFDRFVRPACLHSDISDPTGAGTAAGWGKNETHGPKSSALMQVGIKFVPAEECKRLVGVVRKYLPKGVDKDTMVCAGELGKDTCQGDSGGPLILPSTPWSTSDCLAKLVGVTSFGPRNCGMTTIPGAYVRVAHFLPWIESIVWLS